MLVIVSDLSPLVTERDEQRAVTDCLNYTIAGRRTSFIYQPALRFCILFFTVISVGFDKFLTKRKKGGKRLGVQRFSGNWLEPEQEAPEQVETGMGGHGLNAITVSGKLKALDLGGV